MGAVTSLLNDIPLTQGDLWDQHENPTFIVPDTFIFTNEQKSAFIRSHVSQGRRFEINGITGAILRQHLQQRKIPLQQLHPTFSIIENSIKLVPLMAINPSTNQKELKFSLNFKYNSQIDFSIKLLFYGKLSQYEYEIRFDSIAYSSRDITCPAGKNKTFRSKDHQILANFDFFPHLMEYESMKEYPFSAFKTKTFDIYLLVTPLSSNVPTGMFSSKKLSVPSIPSLYQTTVQENGKEMETNRQSFNYPIRELYCLQIDFRTLQKAMNFISSTRPDVKILLGDVITKKSSLENPVPVQPAIPQQNKRLLSLQKTKPISIFPYQSPVDSTKLKEETKKQESELVDICLVSQPQLELPEISKSTVVTVLGQIIEVSLIDHYFELSFGVYQLHPVFGDNYVKLKEHYPSSPVKSKPAYPVSRKGSAVVVPLLHPDIGNQVNMLSGTFVETECKADEDIISIDPKVPMSRTSSEIRYMNSEPVIREQINPSFESNNQVEDLLCLICMTNKCNVIVYPCRHFNFCLECTQAMIEKNSKCPVCRVDIQFTIYLA